MCGQCKKPLAGIEILAGAAPLLPRYNEQSPLMQFFCIRGDFCRIYAVDVLRNVARANYGVGGDGGTGAKHPRPTPEAEGGNDDSPAGSECGRAAEAEKINPAHGAGGTWAGWQSIFGRRLIGPDFPPHGAGSSGSVFSTRASRGRSRCPSNPPRRGCSWPAAPDPAGGCRLRAGPPKLPGPRR